MMQVEAQDTSVIAQLGWPDMRLPLLYSLSWPHRVRMSYDQLDLAKLCENLADCVLYITGLHIALTHKLAAVDYIVFVVAFASWVFGLNCTSCFV